MIVGFGAFRDGLEALAAALAARRPRRRARRLRGEDGRELPQLRAFLDGSPDARRYRAAARLRERVAFAGRLDHDELADLLPGRRGDGGHRARSPRRSGWSRPRPPPAARCRSSPTTPAWARSPRTLAPARPRAGARAWLSFEVGPDAVRELADGLVRLAGGAGRAARAATREAIVAITRERYSWDGVARTVIAAAQGELDELPEP